MSSSCSSQTCTKLQKHDLTSDLNDLADSKMAHANEGNIQDATFVYHPAQKSFRLIPRRNRGCSNNTVQDCTSCVNNFEQTCIEGKLFVFENNNF